MKISIKSCLFGAKQARGLVVIIDVISASSTIVSLFEAGAKEIIPVDSFSTIKNARLLNSGHLLCSESRHKLSVDLVNSPIISKDVKGKTILIKTDAGTRGILEARQADQIVVGSFSNSKAVVDYIKKSKPAEVSLVPIGYKGKRKAIEDELCALYIKSLLEGKKTNFRKLRRKILSNPRNIIRYLIFRKKTRAALEINTSRIVPILVNGKLQSFKSRTL